MAQGDLPYPGDPPEDCTFDQLTEATLRLLEDHTGIRTGLSRSTIHEVRNRKRELTLNTFTKIVNAYAPQDRIELWRAHWTRLTAPAATDTTVVRPRQLPALVPEFTGRQAQLAALDELSSSPQYPSTPILAITGGPGVGKTALAIYWAHRVSAEFPDGQLYADLRGYHPGEPASADEVLREYLGALGEPYHNTDSTDSLAARFRTATAGGRVLIVLDNASDTDHVLPLLPGAGRHCVIVTSRNQLHTLAGIYGARTLELTGLTDDESLELLRTMIDDRAWDEAAARRLAKICAHLPLTLRIAAARVTPRIAAAVRAGIPEPCTLQAFVAELDHERDQEAPEHLSFLDQLELGDGERSATRSVLSWSYKHLIDDAQRALRLFGLAPGADIDDTAATALLGTGQRAARRSLTALVHANLLSETTVGRFSAHDIVRRWAAELADAQDDPQTRNQALSRLVEHYLAHCADTTNAQETRAWLRTEHGNLIATVTYLARHSWHAPLVRLSDLLADYLVVTGHAREAINLHQAALEAAAVLDDTAAQARAQLALGRAHWQTSSYPPARASFTDAARLFDQVGDHSGAGRAWTGLGSVHMSEGHLDEALAALARAEEALRDGPDQAGLGIALGTKASILHALGKLADSVDLLRRAAEIFRQAGDIDREGRALGNLGVDYYVLGDNEQAQRCHREALAVHERHGNRAGEGRAHLGLGQVADRRGDYEEAASHLTTAETIFKEIDDQDGTVSVLSARGAHHRHLGDLGEAQRLGEQACELAATIGERESEAEALNSLGETLFARGDPAGAQGRHQAALTISQESGSPHEQARAHLGLARVHAADDPDTARAHLNQARDTLPGAVSAEQMEAVQAALDGRP